ncbi:uncharacterized protein LOC133176894 isoform X2 [Saccostrea echinata]|uniref:uncharacterized protein LOC133176894 isoform X2 n=1 Tax=Saccostrea echinata TaxID=191078 RepID=UPI002A82B816|nr:uncharacterized protein LOC133176894 isoform X2 [Saccostrea echinata]
MRHQLYFWFNVEAGLLILIAVTLDVVLPFGFHNIGIVAPKTRDSTFLDPLLGPYKKETNEIPVWKKFHFWKRKRNDLYENSFHGKEFQSDNKPNTFNTNSEVLFNEPKLYDPFDLEDFPSTPNDDLNPDLDFNNMLSDAPSSDMGDSGVWHTYEQGTNSENLLSNLLLQGSEDQYNTEGLQTNEKKTRNPLTQREGYFPSGVNCAKTISLTGTTKCLHDEDCKDCYGFVFHCESNFCKLGPRSSCSEGCDLTDTFPSFSLKR